MSDDSDDLFSLPSSGKEWDVPSIRVALALLAERAKTNKKSLEELKETLKKDYVDRNEFKPVMRLVYGMASLMLVGVVTAIVNSVLKVHV